MSELLRLREWLGINDAIRYAEYLGLHAKKLDFFRAYTDMKHPLRLTNSDHRLYSFVSTKKDGLYPRNLWPTWNEERNLWETQDGVIVSAGVWVDIATNRSQGGYSHHEILWITDDLPFDDKPLDVTPVYWESHMSSMAAPYFSAVTWGDVAGDHSGNSLELSRKHIETLVRLAMGQPEPEKKPDLPAPLFANADHESYPPELHTAAMLWEAMYIKNERNQNHSHSQAARLWLQKNQDTMPTAGLSNNGSDAMIERLIKITTPEAKKPKR